MIITIDGPAGTGKSTIARLLAKKLDFVFYNTGAMFRAVTYHLMKKEILFKDENAIKQEMPSIQFRNVNEEGKERYYLNDEEITEAIRSKEVTANVSQVSAIKCVRDTLKSWQRKAAQSLNAIFEGRDMGTAIFPDADFKVFLTASPQTRAQRRYDELLSKGDVQVTLEEVLKEITYRDHFDSTREIAPLKQADDAYVLDTSELSIDEVVATIASEWHKRHP